MRNLVTVDAVLLNSAGTAVVSALLQLPRLRELRCRAVPASLVGLRLQVRPAFELMRVLSHLPELTR